ncbi:RDD family protein [Arthrobacter tumbae]|uniref:RDD family protein n=1 Tax=Arthrobacter tumbae TaxID=163874 RepID=UPI001958B75C|nr:RDD family protein [Arthrobacter tumbae]MBM7782884.1 putative RDD family membrane protein YckC [Arthrobacter tumbae]
MVDRRDIGSWLEGPPSRGDGHWPGQRLGRPRNGAGSIARPGRRLGALAIDWALCSLISAAFFGYDGTATLGIFAVEQMLLVGTLGYSVGHRTFGMQVQRLEGKPAGLGAAIVRTLLICLVIPAVVFDEDQRGLHDRAVGTALVRI